MRVEKLEGGRKKLNCPVSFGWSQLLLLTSVDLPLLQYINQALCSANGIQLQLILVSLGGRGAPLVFR